LHPDVVNAERNHFAMEISSRDISDADLLMEVVLHMASATERNMLQSRAFTRSA